MPIKSNSEERLQKIIARAGLASRRAAEQMIVEGRVQVDGRVVKELGAKADPSESDIRVDGTRIHIERRRRYIMLNKPRGYMTTRSDPGGRPTVMELLPHSLRSVYPVGRLDMSSTGLLLFTDDGDFAQRVGHPRFGIEKTYVVTVRGTPSDQTLERARNGIRVEGEKLKVKSVHVLGSRPKSTRILHESSPTPGRKLGSGVAHWRTGLKRERDKVETARLEVVLVEGKNREVRRLFKALGHPVLELHRSKVGVLSDRGLPEGMFRPLSALEIRQLTQPERSPSSRTRRDRRNEDHRGDPRSERRTGARTRKEERADGRRPRAERPPSPSSRIRRDHRSELYEGERASGARARPLGDGRRERSDRVPPSPMTPSGSPRRVFAKSPAKGPRGSGSASAEIPASKPSGPRRPAFAKASASAKTSAVKPGRPRRSSKSVGGSPKGGGGASSTKRRRVSPKSPVKFAQQSKEGGARRKGDRRAFSKVSKKPGRRAKKGT